MFGSLAKQAQKASIYVQKQNHQREQGNITIKIVFSVSVIAIFAVLLLKGCSYMKNKARVGQAITMIQRISQELKELGARHRDFTGLTTKTVINLGVVDKSDILDKKILSPWYSDDKSSIVTVKVGDNPSIFVIEMNKIPPSACAKVGEAFMDIAAAVSIDEVRVNTLTELSAKCSTDTSAKKLSFNF